MRTQNTRGVLTNQYIAVNIATANKVDWLCETIYNIAFWIFCYVKLNSMNVGHRSYM